MKFLEKFSVFFESKKNKTYERGCVMLYFDFPDFDKLTNKIEKDDIYSKDGYGIETEPHITLLYGLESDVTSREVENILKDINFSSVKIFGVSLFENDEFDVLKFQAQSPSLNESNKKLKQLPYKNDYPDYKPHLTIAYLKSGKGKKYVKKFSGNEWILEPTELIYSTGGGSKIKLKK